MITVKRNQGNSSISVDSSQLAKLHDNLMRTNPVLFQGLIHVVAVSKHEDLQVYRRAERNCSETVAKIFVIVFVVDRDFKKWQCFEKALRKHRGTSLVLCTCISFFQYGFVLLFQRETLIAAPEMFHFVL